MVEIDKKSFHERFHVDSKGRHWDFVQKARLKEEAGPYAGVGRSWNEGKLVWKCLACGGEEPVRYNSFIHDEVIVPDPSEQLDAHDCEMVKVRQVMES